MKHNHKLTPILIILMLAINALLSACGTDSNFAASSATVTPIANTVSATATPTLVVGEHKRWLNKIPCAQPCWEGIIPGKTTAQEALAILKQNPLITNIKTEEYPEEKERGYIRWQVAENPRRKLSPGSIAYNLKPSQEVVYIDLVYSYNFSLGDVIKNFGKPDYVMAFEQVATRHDGEVFDYTVRFFFVNIGMQFDAILPKNATAINEQTQLATVTFSVSGRAGFPWLDKEIASGTILPWQDNKDFFDYCRTSAGKSCTN